MLISDNSPVRKNYFLNKTIRNPTLADAETGNRGYIPFEVNTKFISSNVLKKVKLLIFSIHEIKIFGIYRKKSKFFFLFFPLRYASRRYQDVSIQSMQYR